MFYDYKNIGILCKMNPVRTFINNRFYKTNPYTKFIVSLSIVDDIILKISYNDIEIILDDIHNLREQILYVLSFEKTAKENPDE